MHCIGWGVLLIVATVPDLHSTYKWVTVFSRAIGMIKGTTVKLSPKFDSVNNCSSSLFKGTTSPSLIAYISLWSCLFLLFGSLNSSMKACSSGLNGFRFMYSLVRLAISLRADSHSLASFRPWFVVSQPKTRISTNIIWIRLDMKPDSIIKSIDRNAGLHFFVCVCVCTLKLLQV